MTIALTKDEIPRKTNRWASATKGPATHKGYQFHTHQQVLTRQRHGSPEKKPSSHASSIPAPYFHHTSSSLICEPKHGFTNCRKRNSPRDLQRHKGCTAPRS